MGGEGVDADFKPDKSLQDGEVVAGRDWSLEAIATPGHFSNHLCFSWPAKEVVFSGDHVMSWATTLVSPPDGDVTAFMASLDKMAARRADRLYFPGHGAELGDPHAMIDYLFLHRKERESQIIEALADGPTTARHLAERIYTEISNDLIPAASRNVFAHLIDLMDKKIITPLGDLSPITRFSIIQKTR